MGAGGGGNRLTAPAPVRRAGAAAMPDTRPQIFERPGRDEERKFGIWAAARRHDDFSSNRHLWTMDSFQ